MQVVDYDTFRTMQAEARAEGRYLGVGTSHVRGADGRGFGVSGTEGATVRISANGDVYVVRWIGSHGQSVETTIVQVMADALGVAFEEVTIDQGDTQ